jgi:hypothetical protein
VFRFSILTFKIMQKSKREKEDNVGWGCKEHYVLTRTETFPGFEDSRPARSSGRGSIGGGQSFGKWKKKKGKGLGCRRCYEPRREAELGLYCV